MNPTLQEILGYEPFRRASARIVTGAERLDTPVRWVHITEMPEPARLFQGGELLLTQGRGISETAERQRGWIRALADNHIAGVALELGVAMPRFPDALVDEARSCGLPLIAMNHPAYFMDMTEAVHSAIVDAKFGKLQRAESISRRLSRIALEGAGLAQVVAELARAFDRPVVLSDAAHDVITYAPETPELTFQVGNWDTHARSGHQVGSDDGPAHTTVAGTGCTWQPIFVRGELWGTLHVLQPGGHGGEVNHLALERAAAAIGLAFGTASDAEYLQQDSRSAFVHDLLGGHYADIREMRLKAASFGLDLTGSFRVLVLRPLDELHAHTSRSARPLRSIASAATRILGSDPRPLIGYGGGRLAALLPDSVPDIRDRAAKLVEHCAGRNGIQLLVGISDPTPVTGLPRAYADASDVVRYAVRTGRGRCVLLPDDLGIDRLLMELDQSNALSRHIEHELGPLLDHDAGSGSPLLPTLQSYLEHNCRKADTARDLNIERRTLYHRLERLEKLLRGSLGDPDIQLRLRIALRGREFRRHHRGFHAGND